VPRFVGSCGRGFCDLGIDEEEKRNSGELEDEEALVHYSTHAPRSMRRPR
jgi:hypothetical protein